MGHQEQIKSENDIVAEHLGEQAEEFLREVDAGRYGSDMDNALTRLAYAVKEIILDYSVEEGSHRVIKDLETFQGDIAGMKETVLKQYPSVLESTILKMFAKLEIQADASAEDVTLRKAA